MGRLICINQDDNEERSHQVRKMCDIYAAAFRVIIYIGRDDADSNIAMGMIAGALDYRAAAIGTVKYAVPTFRKFFERPYFSRIWVIQENRHGKVSNTVLWGGFPVLVEIPSKCIKENRCYGGLTYMA
jgi:hypothetical protein